MPAKIRRNIYTLADERGINHQTALLIWESCDSPDEFIEALDEFAEGWGFALID